MKIANYFKKFGQRDNPQEFLDLIIKSGTDGGTQIWTSAHTWVIFVVLYNFCAFLQVIQ